jgi:CheY-like chemotaxis protein
MNDTGRLVIDPALLGHPGGPERRRIARPMSAYLAVRTGAMMASAAPGRVAQPVLLVEDDDDSAVLFTSYAERLGYDVVRARSGEEAIELTAEIPIDLAIVDLLLPGMSGWHLVAKLRSSDATAACPIVVCSVVDRQDYPKDVQGTLPKPYTRRQVEQLLRRLLPPAARP